MKYEYDALTFITKGSPLTEAHVTVVNAAKVLAEEVIIIIGSAGAARDERIPFSFEERKRMIKAQFPENQVIVKPMFDYSEDRKWVTAVESIVYSSIKFHAGPLKIGLIGHKKDNSSFYLDMFSNWTSVNVPNYKGINATDVRAEMFALPHYGGTLKNITQAVQNELIGIVYDETGLMKPEFFSVREGYIINANAKHAAKTQPAKHPRTEYTVDAVVTHKRKVLLIKRKSHPGKGLWAIPGGFLEIEERIVDGAIRELKEETKIKIPVPMLHDRIVDSHVFDAPYRSTRGRVITTAFYIDLGIHGDQPKVTAADDAEFVKWFNYKDIDRSMMFEDHWNILDHWLRIG